MIEVLRESSGPAGFSFLSWNDGIKNLPEDQILVARLSVAGNSDQEVAQRFSVNRRAVNKARNNVNRVM